MTRHVTLPDGRHVTVTPTGARLLGAMLAHGGWRSDVDRIAHPATRDRLIATRLLDPDLDHSGAYRLTADGRIAARLIASEVEA